MEIRLAGTGDTAGWLALVEQVRDSFPGLESREAMEEHRKTVLAFLARDEAICAVDGGRLVGALLFSKKAGMLCFLAVDERCRRRHIAQSMVEYMLTFLEPDREITVTTYREGVDEDWAATFFVAKATHEPGTLFNYDTSCSQVLAALTEEFGSPVQEFRRKRSKGE